MSYLPTQSAFTLALGLAVSVLPAAPSLALMNAPPRRLAPPLIRVNKRPPIPFRPFAMRDPETGKPIPPNTVLTLPSGRSMTAGQYYGALNQLEKEFCAMGYSLQGQERRIPLLESNVDPLQLQRQSRLAVLSHMKLNPDSPGRVRPVTCQTILLDLNNPQGLLGEKPTASAHAVKTWDQPVGDPSILATDLGGSLELNGSKDIVQLDAGTKAGCSIFGQSLTLLRGAAELSAPLSGTMSAKVNASVLGIDVYNLHQMASTDWSRSDGVSKPINLDFEPIEVPLGPLTLTAKFGLNGTAEFTYCVVLRHGCARARMNPVLQTKVYVQAGVDFLGLAGADVEGDLTLLDDNLELYGDVDLTSEVTTGGSFKPYYRQNYYCQDSLKALCGSLILSAWIELPCFSIPPWCKKEVDWTVWDGCGVDTSGYLFNEAKKTYLYP
jgi:hypothetical protein